MSNYEDDQSEDGELARSPIAQEEMDFSLSEEDMDTNDSLDIRPPQAKVISSRPPKDDRKSRHSGKAERHKEHSHRDKKHTYRERDKADVRSKKENELIRHREPEIAYHGKDHIREREYVREKEIYREKHVYRDRDHIREKEVYKEKDVYREPESYRDREKEAYLAKDRERERYPDGERSKERKRADRGDEAGGRPKERERGDRGDKELEDLRSRLLSKRRTKEQQQDRRRDDSPDRRGDSYRPAHLQRRDKLLHTEREMSRRKEEGRAALEERRSRRAKRPPSPPAPLPSPPPAPKRARPSTSPPEVVTVSDASEHEEQEEGEHSGTSSESSSASDSDGDTASGEGEESAEGDEEEAGEGETGEVEAEGEADREAHSSGGSAHLSPASIHSDTPKRRSQSRSRSRSRSHSFSPPNASNGGADHQKVEGEGEGEEGSPAHHATPPPGSPQPPLPPYYPALQGCRSVEEFQCLNRIEEGTYGVVYRARDKTTEEIVALKRLKMEKEKEGFPITSLREINTLLKGQHPNIVTVREIVVGSNMDKIFIVMDYVEHDLKGLMETMRARKQVFLPGEVKCLMQQLLRAVDHLHDNWILHRDLKTSNLLLSHKGILKVGDFGLAREYGSPLKSYTPVVVTLWYRAPELLLAARTYSTPIDMWSVGCIFSEFITMQALFPGKSEVDQLNRIFKDLGTPNETVWPGWSQLSGARAQWAEQAGGGLRARVGPALSDTGLQLLQGLLTYEPSSRLQASKALQHNFFKEQPLAIDPAMFPTWPAKSEGGRKQHSPRPPAGGDLYKQLMGGDEVSAGFHMGSTASAPAHYLPPPTSFALKF